MTNRSGSQNVNINRALIGGIALGLLLGAGTLCLLVGSQNVWTGACLKVGLVMGALWLATPATAHRTNWGQASVVSVFGIVGLALVLTGKRVDFRLVLAMLAGAVLAALFLRPRSR